MTICPNCGLTMFDGNQVRDLQQSLDYTLGNLRLAELKELIRYDDCPNLLRESVEHIINESRIK